MSEYQLEVLKYGVIPVIVLAIVIILYFMFDENEALLKRVLSFSHSIIPILGFLYAVAVCASTSIKKYEPENTIFTIFMVSSLIFCVSSFFTYRGPKLMHGALVFVVSATIYLTFIGGMAITHDWI